MELLTWWKYFWSLTVTWSMFFLDETSGLSLEFFLLMCSNFQDFTTVTSKRNQTNNETFKTKNHFKDLANPAKNNR